MLRKPKLLAEIKFGRLRIVRRIAPDIFRCQCDCGNTVELWKSQLWCAVKRHCGCRNRDVNGSVGKRYPGTSDHTRCYTTRSGKKRMRTTWEYNTWKNMKERCTIPTRPEWETYGGRGIRVCERWLLPKGEGFRNFLASMGPRPQGMTLDRINPQGHYEPTNCRWATAKDQVHNQRRFLWKDETPPPVESPETMEARIAEYEEDVLAY